jgi:hypothetical protein
MDEKPGRGYGCADANAGTGEKPEDVVALADAVYVRHTASLSGQWNRIPPR